MEVTTMTLMKSNHTAFAVETSKLAPSAAPFSSTICVSNRRQFFSAQLGRGPARWCTGGEIMDAEECLISTVDRTTIKRHRRGNVQEGQLRQAYSVILAEVLLAVSVVCCGDGQGAHNSSRLADAPWPMFMGGPLHTGRSPYVGAQTPSQIWAYASDAEDFLYYPVIGSDGAIYAGSANGSIVAINADGTPRWKFGMDARTLHSPAITADGTVYAGSLDGKLYAIRADGTLKWKFVEQQEFLSAPAIAADGTIYIGNDDGNLYAIRPDGTQKWKFTTGDMVFSSPAIATDGTVYVGSADGYLYAIHPNGSEKWKFAGSGMMNSTCIGADGTIYISGDSTLYAVAPDGTGKWWFSGQAMSSGDLAIAADGTIYYPTSSNGNLYAINLDGTQKWAFKREAGAYFSSLAIGADGVIYAGSETHDLYAITPDGTQKWVFTTAELVRGPAIGTNGTVYIGTGDGHIYAIGP